MQDIGAFFLQVLSIAFAGALFVAFLALFFEKVLPRITGSASRKTNTAQIQAAFPDGSYVDVLLSSRQVYRDLRFDSTVQLDAAEGWNGHWFAVLFHRDGRQVLIRLDAVRAIEATGQSPLSDMS